MVTLARSWRDLPLSDADRAMLAYVELLTLTPSQATPDHVARLRAVGFGDAEIFEIVLVTGYYALRCRMADGLGVEAESGPGRDAALAEALSFRRPIAPAGE